MEMVGERARYLQLVTLKEPPLTVSGISTIQPSNNSYVIKGRNPCDDWPEQG